jgi:hypothetical protein
MSRVNPVEYEAELKALMTEHGIPWFADFFDRGYHALVEDGGASWVGFDDADRIQMSMTQFVHRFQFSGGPLLGSATGNVMVAPPYRTFFPAVALFRRMLADIRDQGDVDFVYGDPTPGAVTVCKAVKMDHVGDLDRLVIPIADAGFTKHLGARLFALAPFVLGGRTAPDIRCSAAANCNLGDLDHALGPDDRLIPRHPISMMRRRLHGFPASNDFVVEMRWTRGAAAWDALVQLRLAEDTRILSILSIQRRSDISLRNIIPALPPVARRLDAHRLQVEALVESKMGREFRSLGFRPRGDTLPIFVKAFSKAGNEAVRNVASWELTALDVER